MGRTSPLVPVVNAAPPEKMGRGGHPGGRRFARFEEDVKEKPLDYWKIARKTAPLLWPENLRLKARVLAVGCTLLAARGANLMVPQLYKGAIDALSGTDERRHTSRRSSSSVT